MPLTYKPKTLEKIDDTCRDVTRIAHQNQQDVVFKFNRIELIATPQTTAIELENRYWHLWERTVISPKDLMAML